MLEQKKLSLREQKRLARNDNTPGEILAQLIFGKCRGKHKIRQLVAKNPNTPIDIETKAIAPIESFSCKIQVI